MGEETEKFGRVVFDGRIYDLDTMSSEELKDLLDKIEEKDKKLENEFDGLLGDE